MTEVTRSESTLNTTKHHPGDFHTLGKKTYRAAKNTGDIYGQESKGLWQKQLFMKKGRVEEGAICESRDGNHSA